MQKVTSEWRELGLKACDNAIRAYWVCRQETGLMVVFKCRQENDAMKKCLTDFTTRKDEFDAFRAKRVGEIRAESAARLAAAEAAGLVPSAAVTKP
jgi:hypothetical protein